MNITPKEWRLLFVYLGISLAAIAVMYVASPIQVQHVPPTKQEIDQAADNQRLEAIRSHQLMKRSIYKRD